MRRLPWNSCTTFAAIGSALAYLILIPGFGFYWELIPGGLAGLIASYAVSTMLGAWYASIDIGRHLAHQINAGIGAALLTLLAGALAITTTNFLLQSGIDLADSPAGQPFWNAMAEFVPSNAVEFIVQPTLAGLMVLLFAGMTILVIDERNRGTHVPVGVPVVIAGCGSARVPDGELAYCRGTPCVQGLCEWGTEIDAVAVLVLRPANSQWQLTGGGMGNTSSPHIVRHHTHWVQPGPVGYFDDWSYTVGVGQDALNGSGVTLAQLQGKLDEVCARIGGCDQSFQIAE